ncbi:MAG: KPN_02809 family neutral zinc metallopeptidase [Pyrinomonadaceae bacterium]
MLEGEESTNIEDRRGMGGRGLAIGGGGLGMLVIGLLIYLCGGSSALNLFNQVTGGGDTTQVTQTQTQNPASPRNDPEEKFISSVLKSTEDVWSAQFRKIGKQYTDPKLVLYTGQTPSACGQAQAAVGPFYCPGDEKLYLDFAFFDQLKNEFHAPGNFAQAYVVAHEVGHHVQDLLGTMDKVTALQQRAGEAQANQLSVGLELQADCYAGVWAHDAQQQGKLQVGDVEEALRAASAVGDDNIQKETQGYVVPDSFTHGSSQQRMSWFTRGFQSGDMKQCNTFGSQ